MLKHGGRLDSDTLALADVDVRRGADFWEGWSGMNLVDLATLQIYRGLLFANTSLVAEGFSAVWGQLAIMQWPAPTPSATRAARCNSSAAASTPCIPDSCQVGGGTYLGAGIQADDSFHQHGAQLEDGSYVYSLGLVQDCCGTRSKLLCHFFCLLSTSSIRAFYNNESSFLSYGVLVGIC